MYKYTQEDINLMTSHIHSTARDSLNGATPFDLADLLLDKRIPPLAGLKNVSTDEVMLKPALIESNNSKEVAHENNLSYNELLQKYQYALDHIRARESYLIL